MNPPAPAGSGIELDHLVVAADTIDQGVAWCESVLGVAPGAGGRHPMFGTHNRLLNVTSQRFSRAYLEIIAVDPQASAPGRRRWFDLDDPQMRDRLRESPRLIHAVLRTPALDQTCRALAALGHDVGEPLRASRDTLSWQIVVRSDGRLLAGGALPTLIQWDGPHPTDTMRAAGLALQGLTLDGLSSQVAGLLATPGIVMLDTHGPALRARLSTPKGEVILESR